MTVSTSSSSTARTPAPPNNSKVLATTVGGMALDCCVYNASGPRTGAAQALAKIASSSSGAVLAKSATLKSQTGNPTPRIWHHDDGMCDMNSEGLPNSGIEYYIAKETIDTTLGDRSSTNTKPYFVSISGKTLADNVHMFEKIVATIQSGETRIASVELNLACPNIIGKPIIAYDFEQLRDILETLSTKDYHTYFTLGVKLPPYLDGSQLQMAAAILNDYTTLVKYVVCINTLGNALAVDVVSDMTSIRANQGFAGLSGPAIKYTALSNVRQMRSALKREIDVVGVGGIASGQDVLEFLLCGATAVQVGTCHWKEGPACFNRITDELELLLKEKGYATVQDCIGQLQPWSKDGAAKARLAKKEQQQLKSGSASTTTTSSGMLFHRNILELLLVLVIAILLADKFQGTDRW